VIASTSNVPEPTITPAKPNMRASLSALYQYVPDWLLDRSRTLAHFAVALPSSAEALTRSPTGGQRCGRLFEVKNRPRANPVGGVGGR
jgi:hypothetical protein